MIGVVGWRKSSFSGPNTQCVELSGPARVVGVRDSKDPAGGHLVFGAGEVAALVAAAKAGELDDLG